MCERVDKRTGYRYSTGVRRNRPPNGKEQMGYIEYGTPAFRRVTAALFVGGFVTFATLYCTQPLLPLYTHEFHVTPVQASLSLSVTSAALSICMLLAGSLSEASGRKSVMVAALFATSALTILAALSPTFGTLLVVRAAQGIALSGLPAIAMAYLSEEIDPRGLGLAMGMYISGNGLGGMSGRIAVSTLTDLTSWRIALGIMGGVCVVASLWFWRSLPPSAHFQPRPLAVGQLTRSLLRHLGDRGLLCLFAAGFLLMGSFVTLYNYIGFQLLAPPYSLSQAAVGWIFLVYLVGTFSSTWMGRLADRMGRRRVLWIAITIMLGGALLTLPVALIGKLIGLAAFTFGFFGSHSIASSWVGRRAQHDRAQASSLYLFFYYMGSSIGGSAGGIFWVRFGWIGVIGMIAVFLALALALAATLTSIPPVAVPPIETPEPASAGV